MSKIKKDDKNESRVFGQRLKMPTFHVESNPVIKIGNIKRRRFDIIDRSYVYWQDEIESILSEEYDD